MEGSCSFACACHLARAASSPPHMHCSQDYKRELDSYISSSPYHITLPNAIGVSGEKPLQQATMPSALARHSAFASHTPTRELLRSTPHHPAFITPFTGLQGRALRATLFFPRTPRPLLPTHIVHHAVDGEEEEEELDEEQEFDDYDAYVSVCVGGCLAVLPSPAAAQARNWVTSSSSAFHACRSNTMTTRGMVMMGTRTRRNAETNLPLLDASLHPLKMKVSMIINTP